MTPQEINERIKLLGEYEPLCTKDCRFDRLQDYNHGHKYWKCQEFDIYYYVDNDRVFMFEKDFGGNYRFKEIESQDVRLLEALDQHTWMWKGPGITHDFDNMIVYIENGPLINPE